MAGPITWQNVTGHDPSRGQAVLQSATAGLTGGFDKLEQVFKGYQGREQKLFDQAEDVNVQNFMERLQRAQTPEEMGALRSSGELDAMRSALSPASLGKVRGAEDARTASLMQQVAARNSFDDGEAARTAAPVFEAYRLAVLNKDEGAQVALRTSNPNLRGWDKAVANEQATERTFKEQERADRIAPLTEANAMAEAELKQLALGTAKQTAAESAEEKRLSDRLAQAQQDYLGQQTEREQNLGRVALRMGFPTDAAGMARVDDMTQEQLIRLDNEAILNNLPTVKDVMGSDTTSANQFLDTLTKSGDFSARTLQKHRDSIRGAFASNGLRSAVGNDAAAIDRAAAQNRVMFDEIDRGNWYAPGAPSARQNYEQLAKDVPALLDKTTGLGADEDVADIQSLVHEMSTKGIEVKPGVFMTPSVNDMQHAIRTASGGWFTDKKRADNALEILEKLVKTPEIKKRMEEAGQSEQYRRKQAVREILKGEPTKSR